MTNEEKLEHENIKLKNKLEYCYKLYDSLFSKYLVERYGNPEAEALEKLFNFRAKGYQFDYEPKCSEYEKFENVNELSYFIDDGIILEKLRDIPLDVIKVTRALDFTFKVENKKINLFILNEFINFNLLTRNFGTVLDDFIKKNTCEYGIELHKNYLTISVYENEKLVSRNDTKLITTNNLFTKFLNIVIENMKKYQSDVGLERNLKNA